MFGLKLHSSLVLLGVFLAAVAAAPSQASAAAGGATAGLYAKAKAMSTKNKLAAASKIVTQMRQWHSAVSGDLAKAQKNGDLGRMKFLQPKVTALRGLLKLVEQSNLALQEALTNGDSQLAEHELVKMMMAGDEAKKAWLEAQAASKVSHYTGDTKVKTEGPKVDTKSDPTRRSAAPVILRNTSTSPAQ